MITAVQRKIGRQQHQHKMTRTGGMGRLCTNGLQHSYSVHTAVTGQRHGGYRFSPTAAVAKYRLAHSAMKNVVARLSLSGPRVQHLRKQWRYGHVRKVAIGADSARDLPRGALAWSHVFPAITATEIDDSEKSGPVHARHARRIMTHVIREMRCHWSTVGSPSRAEPSG